jgi:hypothetical protein
MPTTLAGRSVALGQRMKLGSKKVDGNRVYQITSKDSGRSGPRLVKHRSP